MKTHKELLILLLNITKKEKSRHMTGLCLQARRLEDRGFIIEDELEKLLDYFIKHRPKRGKFYDESMKYEAYFWRQQKKTIRIEWIKYRIGKH